MNWTSHLVKQFGRNNEWKKGVPKCMLYLQFPKAHALGFQLAWW